MRQCLPRGKDLDLINPRAQSERRFFGLAPGWGHDIGCATSASGHRCNQGNARTGGSNGTTRDPLVNGFKHLRQCCVAFKRWEKRGKLRHLGSLLRVQALLRLTETCRDDIFDNVSGLGDGH